MPKKVPAEPYPRKILHRDLMRAVLTEPLLTKIQEKPDDKFDIIVALNEQFPAGLKAAHEEVVKALSKIKPKPPSRLSHPNYIFVTLTGRQIQALAEEYREYVASDQARWKSPVYRVWEDQDLHACLTRSLATIKADASHKAFNAMGQGITWAVLDSGIDDKHVHFTGILDKSLSEDFIGDKQPFVDEFGHGTHVAGIISGGYHPPKPVPVVAVESLIEGKADAEAEDDDVDVALENLDGITGIAPRTKLVSLKVLDSEGRGKVSAALLAIHHIQTMNQFGRRIRIHGANLSIAYDFNPRWFGCGQSPLCVEVDRLVKAGVAVVVAAGNTGYSGLSQNTGGAAELGYRPQSINDPGNAELAITVGSTHRDMPHTYGVSYFSSRGPTGDGRMKPDLVAPGERIVSCAAGVFLDTYNERLKKKGVKGKVLYLDQSGTSMAAPHVSGAIAAFLSVRREFIGQPEKVKKLFLSCAVDLGRERSFQGHGLLDLLKVLQAV
jgi:serine protease AprX